MRITLLSYLIFLALACAGCSMMSPPDNLDLRLARTTEHGLYLVTLQPPSEQPGINRLQTWQLRIAAPDGSTVDNATVSFDGGMPQHHHGFPTSPRVSAQQGGAYRIEGMKFSMAGWWEIKLAIASERGRDSVTFNTVLGADGVLAAKAGAQ
jgi:hypothetical protein